MFTSPSGITLAIGPALATACADAKAGASAEASGSVSGPPFPRFSNPTSGRSTSLESLTLKTP
jgi:hypothetical protein